MEDIPHKMGMFKEIKTILKSGNMVYTVSHHPLKKFTAQIWAVFIDIERAFAFRRTNMLFSYTPFTVQPVPFAVCSHWKQNILFIVFSFLPLLAHYF